MALHGLDLASLRELCAGLDAALTRKGRTPEVEAAGRTPAPAARLALDSATVDALLHTAHGASKLAPASRDPELLLLVLRCLASGVLLTDPQHETAGIVELAQSAASPTDPLVPPATQHAALMLLLNLSRAASLAPAVSQLRPMLEALSKSDDPRVRSLSTAVLGNLAAHGGLLSRLTSLSPPRLQQVSPAVMLATIRRLESGVSSAFPPHTPHNTRIPACVLDEIGVDAIVGSPAARAAVQAAEARIADQGAASEQPLTPVAGVAAAGELAAEHAESPDVSIRNGAASLDVGREGGGPGANERTGGGHGGSAGGLLSGEGAAALSALRVMSQELQLRLCLTPVARATAAWGVRKAGVVLSAVGSILQRIPPGSEWVAAAILVSGGAAGRLVMVHAAARADGDARAAEASLWCLASMAHVCGGQAAGLHLPAHAALLLGSLASTGSLADRLCALAALRCAAADVRSVRLVARHVSLVQSRFGSDSEDEALLACATVANVEQYSHARLWYARAETGGAITALSPPPPPPAPPAVLYSQAVEPPEELDRALSLSHLPGGGGSTAGGVPASRAGGVPGRNAATASSPAGSSWNKDGPSGSVLQSDEVRRIPMLACALHPWVRPAVRAAAAVRLARILLHAWRRGVHDEILLYLLESSLAARRLAFALHGFNIADGATSAPAKSAGGSVACSAGHRDGGTAASKAATQACLFCLAMLPLLGGGATLFTDAVLDRLLPLLGPPTATTHPGHSRLTLLALQNASADARAHRLLGPSTRQKLVDALWRAAALSYAPTADVALSTIANLAAVATASATAAEAGGGAGHDGLAEPSEANFVLPTISPRAADVATVYRSPPPPYSPAAAGVEGYRALPRLCVSLSAHAPVTAKRRALGLLAGLLDSPSLDSTTALSLLAAYGAAERLAGLATASAAGAETGGARRDGQLHGLMVEGALVCLGLVYRLGGARLIAPHLSGLTLIAVSALTSIEPRERAVAVFFWQAATTAVEPASALIKATVPMARLSAAGIATGTSFSRDRTFTSGLGTMRRLAQAPAGGRVAMMAAGALAHVLQHRAVLSTLWTSSPESLSYLERILPEEEELLLSLPEVLRQKAEDARAENGLADDGARS